MEKCYVNSKQYYLRNINNHLDTMVKEGNHPGHANAKKEIITTFCMIWNLARGWNLTPFDPEDDLYSVFQLYDKNKHFAVKISFSNESKDILSVLSDFNNSHQRREYGIFVIFVVTYESTAHYVQLQNLPDWFDAKKNIWNFTKLKNFLRHIDDLEVLEKISNILDDKIRYLAPPTNRPTYLLPPPPRPQASFIPDSRFLAIEEIKKHLTSEKLLFLWGPAGIGKTELAAKLAQECTAPRGNYFLQFHQPLDKNEGAMIETILQAHFGDYKFSDVIDRKLAYSERITFMQNNYAKTLLIIDGFDCPGRSLDSLTSDFSFLELIDLTQHGIQLIFTTRSAMRSRGIEVLPLDISYLNMLIRNAYPFNDAETEKVDEKKKYTINEQIQDLIHTVGQNTLCINLISQILRDGKGFVTPWMFVNSFCRKNLNLHHFPEVVSEQNRSFKQDSFANHLLHLHDLSSIGKGATGILMCASILPESGIIRSLFLDSLPAECKNSIAYVFDGTWLSHKGASISATSLVRQVCWNALPLMQAYTADFLDNLWSNLDPHSNDKVLCEQVATCFSTAADMFENNQAINALRAGRLWELLHDHAKAQHYYVLSLTAQQRNLAAESPELASVYLDIVRMLLYNRQYSKAAEYSLEALKILETLLPHEHIDLITVNSYIGNAYVGLANYPMALKYHKTAKTLCESCLPTGHDMLDKSIMYVQEDEQFLYDRRNQLELLRYQMPTSSEKPSALPISLAQTYFKAGECCSDLNDVQCAKRYYKIALRICKAHSKTNGCKVKTIRCKMRMLPKLPDNKISSE